MPSAKERKWTQHHWLPSQPKVPGGVALFDSSMHGLVEPYCTTWFNMGDMLLSELASPRY